MLVLGSIQLKQCYIGIMLSCYKCSPAPAAPGLGIPPAWLLEPSSGDPGSLSRLRDMADAFPFAGSTSSKAEYISQRHIDTHSCGHTHSQRTPTQPVTQRATDKVLPPAAPTFRTHIRQRQRQNVTSAGHTTGSWNCRMVRVGRDIWKTSNPSLH